MAPERPESGFRSPVLDYGRPAPAPGPSGLPMRLRGWITCVVMLAVFIYLLLNWLSGRQP
jgi:hypothetical protein